MRRPLKALTIYGHKPHRSLNVASSRKTSRVLVPMTAVLVAALAGPFLSTASADPQAFCQGRQKPITCMVIEPNVRRAETEYNEIQFEAGDRVFIEAGGCVQTGGSGRTWKRYVDPASDSDLYHGLINFDGVTPGLVRLQGLVNTTVTIPQAGHLTIGYEDDGYSDNGYYAHDDGTGNQCRNVGAAWIRLTIT
jgi:hypothetical protein